MGDFSISCGMSGLSLINTPVVLFPLIPNKYESLDGKFQFTQNNIVSNEGATALFEPWALPILGELGSYGDFESIESDYNTHSLEKWFGLGIDEIVQEMCYPSYDNEKFPKYHTSMIVDRRVWNAFSVEGLDEWGHKIELKDYKGVSRRDNWRKTVDDWKSRRESDLRMAEYLKGEGDSDSIALFSRVSYYDLQYIFSFGSRRDVEAVLDIYPDAMDSEDFYNRMTQLHCFRWNMMACNRIMMPTYNGYQYGNFYMARKLAMLTAWIATEKIVEYEAYRDE